MNNYRRYRDITVPVPLHDAAKAYAASQSITLRALATDALTVYLADRGVSPAPAAPPANQPPLPFRPI